ncbi:hypothetical protein PG991_015208 [Apiospora marii]|uniref:C2H2-type domain-containing protein n=1 Tax=Apiospora marii TaxID=335849 RepID=A0ABR1R162_9PEZI
MHGQAPQTIQKSPLLGIAGLEACHVFDGLTYTGTFQDQDRVLMDQIRLAEFDGSHSKTRNISLSPGNQSLFDTIHGTDADIATCIDTSHFHSDNDLSASCVDSLSNWESEEDQVSLAPREHFSNILGYLVDSSMRIFFQTLVQEVEGTWHVLRAEVANPNLKVKDLTSTLTAQSQLGHGCVLRVPGVDVCRHYALEKSKGHNLTGFSCHFYKMDPERYHDCRLKGAPDMPSLRRHILRNHRQPPYCPTCFQVFGLVAERDKHVVSRTCNQEASGHVQGISDHQASLIRRKDDRFSTDRELWFYLWDIIFPKSEKPASAHADNSIDELCLLFQGFWKTRGQLVLAFLLKKRGMLNWETPNEENDLASIHSLVFTDVIKRCLKFGTDIFVELQSPSQATIFGNTESTAERLGAAVRSAETRAAFGSAENSFEDSAMAKAKTEALVLGSSTDSTALTDHEWEYMQEWFAFREVENLESDGDLTGASSFSTESIYPQCGEGQIRSLGDTWIFPEALESSNMMQTSPRTAGTLPCEFAVTFDCDRRFELSKSVPKLDLWIDHHRYQHLGGMLPDQCSCWFCGETFAGSDRGNTFIIRMTHIAEHFMTDECESKTLHADNDMNAHLRSLWPQSFALGAEPPRPALRSNREGGDKRADRRTQRGSKFPNKRFSGRHCNSRNIHGQKEKKNLFIHYSTKRCSVSQGQLPGA